MSRDEAKAVLLKAFIANPDLPPEIQAALAKLIACPRKRGLLAFS